ncbi:complement C1q-like protein 3 [Mya arenaria]|uniref:complement C1q-like protein 3 n=1 Tax=Mya arenaria TaxID=6604 RepID=UPI0022E3F22D|nr:complement C1q-like protein 3 [Mya arenaria]
MRSMILLPALMAVCAVPSAANFMKFGNLVVPGMVKRHEVPFAAFSAGLTTMQHNITDKSNVQFDKVFINSGNGYDPSTGVFTCNHDGVYVFIYHGLSESAGTLWLDLYKNDEYQITGYAHNNNDWAAASNAMLLQLAENDRVSVQAHGSSNLYGLTDEVYATFSGFILIPLGQGHDHVGGR